MNIINDAYYQKLIKENIFDLLIYLFNEKYEFNIYIVKKFVFSNNDILNNVTLENDNGVLPIKITQRKNGNPILDEEFLYLDITINSNNKKEEINLKIPLLSIYQILNNNNEAIFVNFLPTKIDINSFENKKQIEEINEIEKSMDIILNTNNKDFFK